MAVTYITPTEYGKNNLNFVTFKDVFVSSKYHKFDETESFTVLRVIFYVRKSWQKQVVSHDAYDFHMCRSGPYLLMFTDTV